MLAFILLVVLGGGVGLLAVSLAESPKPATDRGKPTRAPEQQDDAELAPAEPAPEPAGAVHDPPVEILGEVPEAGDGAPGAGVLVPAIPVPTATQVATRSAQAPRRVKDPRNVPRAHVAIEGRLDEVTPPAWRRLLSLIGIIAIAIAIGIVVAAVAAAIIGALAALVDNAVG